MIFELLHFEPVVPEIDIYSVFNLTYEIVVAHRISIALGTLLEINNHSPSNKRSLGNILKINKRIPLK